MTPVLIPENVNAATATRLYALEVLRRHGGDRTAACKALDVDPQTLRRWMASLEELGLEVPAGRPGRPRVPGRRRPVRLTPPPPREPLAMGA